MMKGRELAPAPTDAAPTQRLALPEFPHFRPLNEEVVSKTNPTRQVAAPAWAATKRKGQITI